MESQTITLILGAIVVLIIINFLFIDDNGNISNSSNNTNNRSRRNIRVTNEMIESVRSIAPGLTTAQIREDLFESGSVQSTVERYLSGVLIVEENDHNSNNNIIDNKSNINTVTTTTTTTNDNNNSEISKILNGKEVLKKNKGPFGGLSFEEKKQEMIMKNRRKLADKRGCDYIII